MFLHKVIQWMQNNLARMVDLFKKLDSDKDGRLSREDFIIGMRLLEVGTMYSCIIMCVCVCDMDARSYSQYTSCCSCERLPSHANEVRPVCLPQGSSTVGLFPSYPIKQTSDGGP